MSVCASQQYQHSYSNQHYVLRITLPQLVNPIGAKRLHRHYCLQPALSRDRYCVSTHIAVGRFVRRLNALCGVILAAGANKSRLYRKHLVCRTVALIMLWARPPARLRREQSTYLVARYFGACRSSLKHVPRALRMNALRYVQQYDMVPPIRDTYSEEKA